MSNFDENSLERFDGWIEPNVVLGLSWALITVALAISITSCVLCCCACCNRNPEPNRRSPLRPKHCVFSIATVILVAVSFVAGGYAIAYKVLDVQDYKGLMRVTGWTFDEYDGEDGDNNSGRDRHAHYVQAKVSLDWGYEWGCPDHDNRHCTSSVSKCNQLICTTNRRDDDCSEEEEQEARRLVEDCANKIFDNDNADGYIPWDETVGPSQDENWPNLEAYGNCDNCEALLDAPDPDALEETRLAVIILLVFGFLCMPIAAYVWTTAPKAEPPKPPPFQGEQEIAVPAEIVEQSNTDSPYGSNTTTPAMVYDG